MILAIMYNRGTRLTSAKGVASPSLPTQAATCGKGKQCQNNCAL